MRALCHLVKKESLLLLRDWHALLLLFLMPTAFILVMSLALRERFAADGGAPLTYSLTVLDSGPVTEELVKKIRSNGNFRELSSTAQAPHFSVVIPKGYARAMRTPKPLKVLVSADPAVEASLFRLFEAGVREAVSRVYLRESMAELKRQMKDFAKPEKLDAMLNVDAVDALTGSKAPEGAAKEARPSAVQQNVPAWLVFAMFFIALPLSTTWVQERSQGTFSRLRSMGLGAPQLLLGKLLPYYAINLAQVVLMLAVGVHLVPLLGGDALGLGDSLGALGLMALALSFASVSYALLIANIVATSEQATIFTGVSNLLLAALGGVMVPRFLMPPAMQELSLYSPMAWGLEGFLDVFLRQGGLGAVLPRALLLLAFGLASLILAAVFLKRSRGR